MREPRREGGRHRQRVDRGHGQFGERTPIKADASTGNARLARILQSGASGKRRGARRDERAAGRRIGTVDAKGVVENLGNFQDIDLANGARA